MGDPGQEFWHVYGSGVLQFEVEVLNLCSKTIQQEIHESPVAASLMLYALGAVKTSRPFDRQVGLQMVQKSLTLSEAEILEHWIPSVQYINNRTGLTLKWWSELEKELTGEDNVNILAMTNDDINRENARREGKREGMLEGIWEGKQEGKQEVAIAMLQDGIEKDFIKKYFDFSDDEVEKLLNGSANGA